MLTQNLAKRDGFQWLSYIGNSKIRDKVQINISAFYESYDIKRKTRATHIYRDLRAKITNEVNSGYLQQNNCPSTIISKLLHPAFDLFDFSGICSARNFSKYLAVFAQYNDLHLFRT